MNWIEGFKRILILITVVCVGLGAYGGYQMKTGVYELRNEDGTWERDSTDCLPGTFEPNLLEPEPEALQFDYRFVGECRPAASFIGGALAGFIPPIFLLILLGLARWILRGFKPTLPKEAEEERSSQ